MGAGVMQQQQEDAATLWGRAGAAPLYQDLSRVPTLCWARGSFWPPWPEPLMDLPSWSMHGGPRAAAAPSPPLPRLPSGAFDPGPAVNGFVTELCSLPTAASLRARPRGPAPGTGMGLEISADPSIAAFTTDPGPVQGWCPCWALSCIPPAWS